LAEAINVEAEEPSDDEETSRGKRKKKKKKGKDVKLPARSSMKTTGEGKEFGAKPDWAK